MNIKLIIFSGFLTAGVGWVLGLAVARIGQPDMTKYRYNTEFYQRLYKQYSTVGAGIGLSAGIAQEIVRQLKQKRDLKELNDEAKSED